MVIGHLRCRYPSASSALRIAALSSSVVEGSPSISCFHADCLFSVCTCTTYLLTVCALPQINKRFRFVCLNVIFKNQLRITLPKFCEGPPLALAGIPIEAEPVIKDQHCSFLKKLFGKIKSRSRGGIQIAVYVNNSCFFRQQFVSERRSQ